jgi:hypothetical protein
MWHALVAYGCFKYIFATLFGRIKNPYGYEIIVLNFYKPGVSPPSKVLAELGGTTTAFVTGHRFGICTQVRE